MADQQKKQNQEISVKEHAFEFVSVIREPEYSSTPTQNIQETDHNWEELQSLQDPLEVVQASEIDDLPTKNMKNESFVEINIRDILEREMDIIPNAFEFVSVIGEPEYLSTPTQDVEETEHCKEVQSLQDPFETVQAPEVDDVSIENMENESFIEINIRDNLEREIDIVPKAFEFVSVIGESEYISTPTQDEEETEHCKEVQSLQDPFETVQAPEVDDLSIENMENESFIEINILDILEIEIDIVPKAFEFVSVIEEPEYLSTPTQDEEETEHCKEVQSLQDPFETVQAPEVDDLSIENMENESFIEINIRDILEKEIDIVPKAFEFVSVIGEPEYLSTPTQDEEETEHCKEVQSLQDPFETVQSPEVDDLSIENMENESFIEINIRDILEKEIDIVPKAFEFVSVIGEPEYISTPTQDEEETEHCKEVQSLQDPFETVQAPVVDDLSIENMENESFIEINIRDILEKEIDIVPKAFEFVSVIGEPEYISTPTQDEEETEHCKEVQSLQDPFETVQAPEVDDLSIENMENESFIEINIRDILEREIDIVPKAFEFVSVIGEPEYLSTPTQDVEETEHCEEVQSLQDPFKAVQAPEINDLYTLIMENESFVEINIRDILEREIDNVPNILSRCGVSNEEVVPCRKYLLKDLKNCMLINKEGNTLLHKAVSIEDQNIIKRLCLVMNAHKLSGDIRNRNYCTPLQMAIKQNADIRIVQMLLNLQYNEKIVDLSGNTLLHLAALCNNKKVLYWLLSIPKISQLKNFYNWKGYTPLMLSVMQEEFTQSMCLLCFGADPNVRDVSLGNTALYYAMITNDLDIVKLLLSWNASVDIENYEGISPSKIVCQSSLSSSLGICYAVRQIIVEEIEKLKWQRKIETRKEENETVKQPYKKA